MIKKLTYIAGTMALVLTVGCGGGSEETASTSGGGEAEAKPKTLTQLKESQGNAYDKLETLAELRIG